jgi:hypothetical protein
MPSTTRPWAAGSNFSARWRGRGRAERGCPIPTLVPLSESSRALVATFSTLTIESPGGEFDLAPSEGAAATSAAVVPGTSISIGQSLSSSGDDHEGDSNAEQAGESADMASNPALPAASAWERFMLGVDEALDEFRREFRGRILDNPEPKGGDRKADAQPADSSAPQQEPTSRRSAPDIPPDELEQEPEATGERARHDEAVDAAVQLLWGDDRGDSRSGTEDSPQPTEIDPPRLAIPLVAATVVVAAAQMHPPRFARMPNSPSGTKINFRQARLLSSRRRSRLVRR